MIRRALSGLSFLIATLATLLLILAVVVRYTVQDQRHGYLLLYFATPWPVIAAGAAGCAAYWFWSGSAALRGHRFGRFTAGWLTVLCLAALFAWLAQDWQWRLPSNARGDFRLVHWNIDRPNWRQAGTFRWLAAQDADLISIAEREPKKNDMSARWQAAFPGYQLVPQRGETLLLVRGEVLSVKKEMRYEGSYATAIRVRIRGHDITVLQVDINGTPWVSRETSLGKVAAVVRRRRAENLLMVGDFNTPLDSAFIPPIRRELSNAFETVGSGYMATWPMPFPVLSLDQVWVSPTLRPVRCEQHSSWRSDHRAVVTEIDFVK